MTEDTIYALATPSGYSALALIRLSGKNTFTFLEKVYAFKGKGKSLSSLATHTIHLGNVFDKDGIIDEAMLSVFLSPNSYTKEDSAEISIHGSPYIVNRLSIALSDAGFRQALPGEFSLRAFMNGRFDLSQAEAVNDIISAQSAQAHKLAFRQFRGEFSTQIELLRQKLIDFTALIELELDFAEEDVSFADRNKLNLLVLEITEEIQKLRESFAHGNVIKHGIPVTITGRPNAGKSTLLNLLLKDEKALVTDIPGTTRDALEDVMAIGGLTFRFIDTAGIRHSDDTIELLGIDRAYKMIERSDIILYIADMSVITAEEIEKDIEDFQNQVKDFKFKKLIIVCNKIDLILEIPSGFAQYLSSDTVFISAKRKENIEMLEDILVQFATNQNEEDTFYISNSRHYEALLLTEKAMGRISEGIHNQISGDLLSADLRDALFHLGSISGTVVTEDILNSVFGNFCIGK